MAARDESLCHLNTTPNPCAWDHVAAALARGIEGSKSVRLCPCHDDRKASLSVNPGRVHRVVWHCGAECDPGDIRAELLALGVDESCLGRYGLSKHLAVPGLRVVGLDRATIADAKRYRAILKLTGAGLDFKLYRMCVQAISEGDGDLPADPLVLLPVNSSDFYALASRAGLGRYKYELFGRWLRSAD